MKHSKHFYEKGTFCIILYISYIQFFVFDDNRQIFIFACMHSRYCCLAEADLCRYVLFPNVVSNILVQICRCLSSPARHMFSHHCSPLVRSDKYFVSLNTCNPTACSHWLTQSQKEADIYYLFIIGWHTIYFSSYWLNILDLSLLHMSSVRWMLVLVENKIFVTSNRACAM